MKPPYQVPSMEEIRAIPWNGFTCASTFSGCGGSSTGYRMAGYKVLWASEFIEAARESYQANAAPYTILDGRDIRNVKPEEILSILKIKPGDLDLFDGSPPCASFSTAGKREAGWGKVKKYSDSLQRTDDLFFEFSRLLRGIQPKTFVAENVSGLVKGTAKGYFLEILKELRSCGYRVQCKVLDAQWLGVPQMRQRTIFVGVREDLGIDPVHPKPLPYRYSVREALPWIITIEGANGYTKHAHYSANRVSATVQAQRPVHVVALRACREKRGAFGNDADITDQPAPTVLADSVGMHWIETETDISRYAIGADTHPTEKRKFSIAELKRICAFPDDFILTGTYAQQWERLGRAVPPVMMSHIAATIRDEILCKIK